ncbi:hypothetical protein KSS94_17830 [Pseudomonas fakonensis]|uniref:Uncharacterized protein n=1 Tax=Pseudomonas fakonensis TaxID=2842355 RepID=A0ABX8N1K7_9PSED|nr:DUF6543 domain-containing protein [Pseudomonas fakonensis]QXH49795.1 hypothetical protein KSS94_17830 [Pseudomonas fakonensis]
MNDNLHQRLAQYSALDCTVARRFSDRPTLLDAAALLLDEQWRERHLSRALDPLALYLASQYGNADNAWVRPLQQVLVERYCRRKTLNLNEADDHLSTHLDSSRAWRVDIDLHQVELLINETAPLLIDTYKQLLVDYWTRFDSSGQTPWGWYAGYLQQRLQQLIQHSHRESRLAAFALATANLVQGYPSPEQRKVWHQGGLTVSHLSIDFSADDSLDVDLASAVLIEHKAPTAERNLALLYTLSGRLFGYDSRLALLQAMARSWPEGAPASPRLAAIEPITGQVFETQALGLLHQQLRVVDHLVGQYHSKLDAINLSLDLDRLSSLIDLCDSNESVRRQPLIEQLPDWLRQANSKALMHYSTLLVDVAQTYQDSNGQFWLDGIDNAEAFANRQFSERFAKDHPQDELLPEQVRIINYQTSSGASANEGAFITGVVTPVEYSLAQLAIANLGLLRPGRVELRSSTPEPLPEWMDEHYLRQLVSELDIATQYPAMLRRRLLDDPVQRRQREQLLTRQLCSQLPALATELYLQGKLPDQALSQHVAEVFRAASGEPQPGWVLRPLGLIKRPGSSVDHPCNTWLIEPQQPDASPCLLYRPLHQDSLLYYPDRLALFVAISTPGALQDDLLHRLPAEARRFYDHGGFLEPHLGVLLEDSPALPLDTPAPVALATEAPIANPGAALYQACVNESIARFEEHATSTAQTRWNSWKELGWLLFNTLLPLAGSTLGKVAWLAQMEVALGEYVSSDADRDPQGHELAMVNLLVNIAMLLFSHSIFRLRLEQDSLPEPAIPVGLPAPIKPVIEPIEAIATSSNNTLSFSWARPGSILDAPQRMALEALRSKADASALKSPIAHGKLQGLYLHDDRLHALIDGKVYEVILDTEQDQIRIEGPNQQPGPWLRRDELGHWQLDLSLRLKGGMPRATRLKQLLDSKQGELDNLTSLIAADDQAMASKSRELATISQLLQSTLEDSALLACTEKLKQLSSFWTTRLERIRAHNALKPVKHFNSVCAHAMFNDSECQRAMNQALKKRYLPSREQLLRLAAQGDEVMSPQDIDIARQRLDVLGPVLEQLTKNIARMRLRQTELSKLANPRQQQITQWRDLAEGFSTPLYKDLYVRFLRMETQLNRLTLVHGLGDEGAFWRDKFWSTLKLAVAQRSKQLQLDHPDPDVSARLLRSIRFQVLTAERQLGLLAEFIRTEAAQQTLQTLRDELSALLGEITRDQAELPDYPPLKSFRQLHARMPALIETRDHGLLLAEPREGDANTVDVPGPDAKTPGRTYHLKQGDWVEVQTAKPAPAPVKHSLKRLLKDSGSLLKAARTELVSLQKAGERYLPAEIEELASHQQQRLLNQVQAIEQRLTEDNQTDEARQGEDAEAVAKSLRAMAQELQEQAATLRVSAALAQKPRMAELQWLLAKREVQVRVMAERTRLAKVKGRPDDYLDEYAISHQGHVLWYAHFHYPAMDSARADFTAGHLKTAEQRHASGTVDVYRAPISSADAERYFFGH